MRPTIAPEADELIDRYFPALDYGFIALKDVMGKDEDIVESARVSYGQGTKKTTEGKNLIRYLYRNKHTTPFEMVEFKFHCAMPIFVARQWIRHRTANVNEYSGRYSLMPNLYYTPKQEHLTTQSANNKQGRTDNLLTDEQYQSVTEKVQGVTNQGFKLYNDLCAEDVARELARCHLPLSTYTYWYWKIDLHNLLHFLRLRCDAHAQYEVRVYADLIAGMVKRAAPEAFKAWEDYAFAASVWTKPDKKLMSFIENSRKGSYVNFSLEQMARAKDETVCKYVKDAAKTFGMTDREYDEFWKKLEVPEDRDFSLDLSKAKDGAFFENIIKENTPQ